MSNANVGMIYPVWAPLVSHTEGSMPVYGTGRVLQEARNATVTKTVNDNPLRGDDHDVDNDNGVTAMNVSFETTGLSDEDRVAVLGEKAVTDGGYLEGDGATPWGGLGYVRRMRANGVRKYEAWLIFKVQFQERTQNTQTRDGQINWGTPTLEGAAQPLIVDNSEEAKYRYHKTFDTCAGAKGWLQDLLHVPASTST